MTDVAEKQGHKAPSDESPRVFTLQFSGPGFWLLPCSLHCL